MFTGIITDIGTVRTAEQRGDLRLVIGCHFDMATVAIGASIACSGVCLTVVDKAPTGSRSISATKPPAAPRRAPGPLARRSISNARSRSATRLGGHIVTGPCRRQRRRDRRLPGRRFHKIGIRGPRRPRGLHSPQGSIAIDGVSLTVNDVRDTEGETHFFGQSHPAHLAGDHAQPPRAGGERQSGVDVLARYLSRMKDHAAAQ